MKEIVFALLVIFFPIAELIQNQPIERPVKVETQKQAVVTIIGDSLTVSVSSKFNQMKDQKIYVNGKIGRQMKELPSVFEAMKAKNQIGDTLVIALGTNGSFDVSMVQSTIQKARESGVKEIYLVNVRMARSWQDKVNQSLQNLVKKNAKDTKLLNWYQESKNHPEYFASDQVHLSELGKQAFVNLIQKSIR